MRGIWVSNAYSLDYDFGLSTNFRLQIRQVTNQVLSLNARQPMCQATISPKCEPLSRQIGGPALRWHRYYQQNPALYCVRLRSCGPWQLHEAFHSSSLCISRQDDGYFAWTEPRFSHGHTGAFAGSPPSPGPDLQPGCLRSPHICIPLCSLSVWQSLAVWSII